MMNIFFFSRGKARRSFSRRQADRSRGLFRANGALGLFLALLPLGCRAAQEKAPALPALLADRSGQIAAWLPAQPSGIGRPGNDRTYWTDPALVKRIGKFVGQANALAGRPFPAWDDAAYLDFSRTGQRPAGEKMIRARHDWLTPLVLSECLENQGRFGPLLNQILQSYSDEPTWTLPAHDGHLSSFRRQQYDVDLGAASFGHEIAEALYLLGDKVNPPVRQALEADLQQRLFAPVLRSVETGAGCFWLRGTNNWNAVCLAGVVGAALAADPAREQRALFAAIGEHYAENFVHGFRPGGYCEEGVGYWGYGFGHYIVLRQELAEATGGRLDLFADPRAVDMALFGVRIEIGKRTVPYFGDCQFGVKPSPGCLAYSNDVFHLGLNLPAYVDTATGNTLEETLLIPAPLPASSGAQSPAQVDPLRSYFTSVGVLCDRPGPGSTDVLGIGIKAGGNGSHSHNDVGSYDIALGQQVISGDPGGPSAYDRETFGPRRFERKILNSYGHPVPLVAGQLQIEATKATPRVVSTSFTDERDEIKLDITSAYAVPALKSLVRTMDYNRAGAGEIRIVDDVAFLAPNLFADTLITDGDWRQVDDHTVLLSMSGVALRVTVHAPGGFTVKAEKIQEMGARAFTRLGLELAQPIATGEVEMIFTPAG